MWIFVEPKYNFKLHLHLICSSTYFQTGGYTNCYTGNEWDPQYCPNNAACTRNCALDGVDTQTYSSTYGIHASQSGELELKFVTHGQYSDNIGSRTFLLDSSHNRYVMHKGPSINNIRANKAFLDVFPFGCN